MERGSNGEDRITKAKKLPWETAKKLKSSKEVNESGKRSYKEIIWQKEVKSQDLKEDNNVWLGAKNIHSTWLSRKLNQKRYGSFKITKNIGQETFQLKLLERWAIHNMFNKDLLTWYRELQFKRQYMYTALLLDIIDKEEEYKVKEI